MSLGESTVVTGRDFGGEEVACGVWAIHGALDNWACITITRDQGDSACKQLFWLHQLYSCLA